jgi:predicted DNA-binding ribbon-helix-helix protein
MAKESFKISGALLSKIRKIAERDGMILTRLIERLIESGIKAENLK